MINPNAVDQIATEHVEMSELSYKILKDQAVAEFVAGAFVQQGKGQLKDIIPLLLQTLHYLSGYDVIDTTVQDLLEKLAAVYKEAESKAAQIEAKGKTCQ